MRRFPGLIALSLLGAMAAFGQGAVVPPQTAFQTVNGVTRPIGGATITVCAASTSGIPCTPVLVNSLFKDAALSIPLSDPFTADANGNYQFAISPGNYTVTVTAKGFSGYSYQITAAASGGGGGSGTVQAAPQFHLFTQPTSGSQTIAGPSNITTDSSLNNLNVPGLGTLNGVNVQASTSWNGSTGSNAALKFWPSDAVLYVGVNGNDSNDGLSAGSAKATISGALAALPSCTYPGPVNGQGVPGTQTEKCGTINVASNGSGYALSSQVTITSTAIRIMGGASQPTVINCSAAICFEIDAPSGNGAASNFGGGFNNITLIGNGSSGQIGVLNLSTTGTRFDNFHAAGFSGSGATGIEEENDTTGINERTGGANVFLENNTCDLSFVGNSTTPSFGHQFWDTLDITLFSGQTAFCVGSNVHIYSSSFMGVINGSNQAAATATAISMSATNASMGGWLDMPIDAGGAETITWCSGCSASNFNVHGFALQNDSNFHTQDSPVQIIVSALGQPNNSLSFLEGNPGSSIPKWSIFLDGSNNLGIYDAVNSLERFEFTATGAFGLLNLAASGYDTIARCSGLDSICAPTGMDLGSNGAIPNILGGATSRTSGTSNMLLNNQVGWDAFTAADIFGITSGGHVATIKSVNSPTTHSWDYLDGYYSANSDSSGGTLGWAISQGNWFWDSDIDPPSAILGGMSIGWGADTACASFGSGVAGFEWIDSTGAKHCIGGGGSSITLQTNTTGNSSASLLNFTNSSTNATGLAFNFSNPSGGIEKGEIAGTLNAASVTAGSNGQVLCTTSGASAWCTEGVTIDAQSASTSYTIPTSDNLSLVKTSGATLTGLTGPALANNIAFSVLNRGSNNLTFTPASGTVNGSSTQAVPVNFYTQLFTDNSNTYAPVMPTLAWFSAAGSCSGASNALTFNSTTFVLGCNTISGGGGGAFPQTVSGTVTSGAIPYFNSTTQMSSSAVLPAGDFMLGGGAGSAPTATFSVVPFANGGLGTSSITALQGTDTSLLTSGTVSGTGASLCTDANGGATTTGCSGGGGIAVNAFNATAQAANIAAQTLTTPSANGFYRISVQEELTTAATTSSTLPNVQVGFTTGDGSSAKTITVCDSSTINTVGTICAQGSGATMGPAWSFYAKSGVAITVSTIGYLTSGATSMAYAIHVRLEGPF